MQGLTTVGQIVAFMSLATSLIGRLEQIVSFVNFMFSQAPQLAQFFAVMDARSERRRPPGRDRRRAAGRAMSASRTSRSPTAAGATRLRDVSFDAPAGRTIALVGATGSGKSTTLALLHRVFDPTEGRITIDGRDIRDMTLASLRANIGVVFQEPFLFARSIEENLRIGKPDASAEPRSSWRSSAPRPTNSCAASRRGLRPSSASAGAISRAASASGSRSRARS